MDDGSTDGSAELVDGWARTEDNVVLVQLSRNFGMEIAMSAGLDHARGDYVVLMHADLQDPPELIPRHARSARATRRRTWCSRAASAATRAALKRALATGFYATDGAARARALPGPGGRLPADVAARGRHAPARCPSGAASCAGWSPGSGFKQVPIEYRRAGRTSGRGASYPQLFRLALEALTSFSDVPLRLATYVGRAHRQRSAAWPRSCCSC